MSSKERGGDKGELVEGAQIDNASTKEQTAQEIKKAEAEASAVDVLADLMEESSVGISDRETDGFESADYVKISDRETDGFESVPE